MPCIDQRQLSWQPLFLLVSVVDLLQHEDVDVSTTLRKALRGLFVASLGFQHMFWFSACSRVQGSLGEILV